MITVFVGTDSRQPLGTEVFVYSVNKHCSEFVMYHFLNESLLKRKGLLPEHWDQDQLSPHGRARFLVPYLSQYQGWSLFVDGTDMMVRDDLRKLWALRDEKASVMIVPHQNFDRDFMILGREHKSYNRFNWSSVMLFNNALCKELSPEYVLTAPYRDLHNFSWTDDTNLGHLPSRWNHLVGFYAHDQDAALVHWTDGAPLLGGKFKTSEFSEEWFANADEMKGIRL